jgi:DeoR family deoxyribose operon repressor
MPAQKRRDRFSRIIQYLQVNRGATLEELAEQLAVSEMTVRRDLEDLAAKNAVRLVHTGAILPAGVPLGAPGGAPGGVQSGVPSLWSTADGDTARAFEKMRIGRKAASLVDPGDTLIVDSGAAAEWLVRALPPGMPLTIICSSLNILVEARRREKCAIVLAGGAMREDTLAFESAEGVGLMRRHRANKAFLAASGVSERLGVTCPGSGEAEMRKAAVASSQTRVLIADSDAFGRVAPAWFAELKDFDVIVTDSGISLGFVEIARTLGIALHVA